MCIVCTGEYDISLTQLLCHNCQQITEIPKELINLNYIECGYTKISKIPKEFENLTYLYCENSKITEIPKELNKIAYLRCKNTKINNIPFTLIHLQYIELYNTKITEIPKELVNLNYINCCKTKIKTIPKELVNLTRLICDKTEAAPPFYLISSSYNLVTQDKSWFKTKHEIKKIIKLQKYWKIYFKYPILWKIAEYYTAKKYSPKNIMKYIDLK